MTKQPQKTKSTAKKLIAGGLGLLVLGMAYQFLTPKIYQAKSRIEFGRREGSGKAGPGLASPGLSSEYSFFSSPDVLDQVVQNLHLRESWAARAAAGASLSPEAARLKLRAKVRVEIIDYLKMIEITVISEERAETAQIANELARLYSNHRQAEGQKTAEMRLGEMSEEIKPLWEEATAKARVARERLNAVTEEINRARAASPSYEPAELETIRGQRIKLENEYVSAHDMEAQLKAFTPAQLRDVLPTIITNVLLEKTLDAYAHARTELAEARATKGANSAEATNAAAVVAELDQRADLVVSGIMLRRDSEVAAKKSALDAITEKLAHARTTVIASLTTNNVAYQAALNDLQQATKERDMITNRLSVKSTAEALAGTLEAVDEAAVPAKPVSPDENLSQCMLVIGGVGFVAGWAMFFLAGGVKPPAAPARTIAPLPSPRRN